MLRVQGHVLRFAGPVLRLQGLVLCLAGAVSDRLRAVIPATGVAGGERGQSRPEPPEGWRTISTTRSSLEPGLPPSLLTVPATDTFSDTCDSEPSLP